MFPVPDAAPTSTEGKAFFASLFEADPGEVRTFGFRAEPGVVDSGAHLHTETIAAWILHGRIEFGVGEGFGDTFEVGPGQCIRVEKDAPHLETVLGDDPVHAVIAHVHEFEIQPLD